MEIEVGEYVRTKMGTIGKFKYYGDDKENIYFKNDRGTTCVYEKEIVKHSKNIIDLIEVGDFVNGDKITEISQDPFVKGQINLWTDIELRDVYGDYERLKYICDEIKSIITKEQIKQIEYRIKE